MTKEVRMTKVLIDGVIVEVPFADQGFPTPEEASQEVVTAVRAQRDSLLGKSDWMATSDRTMSGGQVAYRQALRDVTTQVGYPLDVIWPTLLEESP
jgi:hypothetical protein|tara:strand:+ start:339 stop:626 length:288 start_codon:yes stop_codon:yes gene_type:complete